MVNWHNIADKAIQDNNVSKDEALAVLKAQDSELLNILSACFTVRRHFYGNKVRIHILQNAKSGLCPEDCSFCSQSSISKAPTEKYRIMSKDELVAGAYRAKELFASKYCIVTSTREPSEKELDVICDAVKEIKKNININVCTSLGLLNEAKAQRLKDAGVDRFNHNIETAERLFPQVCTTHTYDDRVRTVRIVKQAGMDACCGCIIGMDETDEDIVDIAFALKELDVDSIPVNFLNPRPGTPMDGRNNLTPIKCLKVLAMFRFVNPAKDIRVAGGREVNLRALQPLSLYAVNSMFTEGYLTTGGQTANEDYRMLEDMGFVVEGRNN